MDNHSNGNSNFQWIDINDYSRLKNISISTIRRRIKSDRLVHQFVDGKYFIKVSDQELNILTESNQGFEVENARLRQRVGKLQEELDDLKTLLSVYESGHKINHLPHINREEHSENPPAIPS